MTTCLITGGAGNLACQLGSLLARRFDQLVLLDVAPRPAARAPSAANYVQADLTDEPGLNALLGRHRPDVVVHLASLLSGGCEVDRARAWRVNADGTFFLLEAALRHGVRTVLFTSTVAAFGGELPDPLTEDVPQWPDGLYGVTKVACERLGVYYHRRHGLDFRCVRLPITVSPFAPPGAASAFASHAFIDAVRHGRFTFRVRPETRLAVVYVQDAIGAIAALLAAPAERLTRRVYNLHALTVTPRGIAAAIAQRLPATEFSFDPDPQIADLLASWPGVIDDARARKDWDWQPQFDLDRTADHILQEIRREAGHA